MNTTWFSLSPAELRARLDSSAPCQLFDVRPYPEFAAGHIHGAYLLPLDEISQRLGEVADLTGGVTAWAEAGFSLEKPTRAPWSLERQVRIAAGTLMLLGVALGLLVHPAFFGLSAFVGAGLVFAGLTDWCGMGLLLAKMPWNRAPQPH